MNIKLSLSLLLIFGVISGCSNSNSVETADTPVETVAEEPLPIEQDRKIEPEAVEINENIATQMPKEEHVVEAMEEDNNDPAYTELTNHSDNKVEDDVGFEERGDIISDEFAANPDS